MTHNSWIVKRLAEAGYDIEPAVDDPDRTVVVTYVSSVVVVCRLSFVVVD